MMDDDVLEISSDDDDVIEISSSDEVHDNRPQKKRKASAIQPRTTASRYLVKENERLKEITRLEDRLRDVADKLEAERRVAGVQHEKAENERLKAEKEKEKAGKIMAAYESLMSMHDISSKLLAGVDEEASCDICTTRMWAPYNLSCCGHTFSGTCLTDWFNTIRVQHLERFPDYARNIGLYETWKRNPIAGPSPVPCPQYTCPLCKEQVDHTPVKVFKLMRVAEIVAEDKGEQMPEVERQQTVDWSGFFWGE